jgi:hypothetical protein
MSDTSNAEEATTSGKLIFEETVNLTCTGTAVEDTEATATSDEETPLFNEEQIVLLVALLDEKMDEKIALLDANTFANKPANKPANTHILLPEDTFSFFAFVGVYSWSFFVAFLVFFVQVTTLSLLIADSIDRKNEQNPLGIPASVESPVRASQLLALLIAVISQTDVVSSANLLYNVLYKSTALHEALTLTAGSGRTKWFGSLFSRFFEGCLGLTVTFILIMRADTVRDVLLNFTAVEFVSSIDNVVFYLAKYNYFGRKVKYDAENEVINGEHFSVRDRNARCGLHFVLLSVIFLSFFGGWLGIVARQNKGGYLSQTVFVQFDDEFSPELGTFSGLYRIGETRRGVFSTSRVEYVEIRSGKASLGYCENKGIWTLSITHDPCSWLAKSSDSTSFDILDTLSSEWFSKDTNGNRVAPMQHFEMSAHGGGRDQNECGGHGSVDEKDKKCECDGDWFGLKCEFLEPCESLAVDIRREGFLSGSREWSLSYDILRTNTGKLLEVYDHPVFFNDTGRFQIILFAGRRWVLFEWVDNTGAGLEAYLREFHAHFTDFNASFISEPMDVGTPTDALTPVGLEWFFPRNGMTPQGGIQSVDSTRASDALLLCAVCDNTANVCQNNGQCENDGTCKCGLGSEGRMCEKPPIGNGRCDSFFNHPEFNFDGGDCCEAKCVSSLEYICGKDDTGYADIGYPSCKLAVNYWTPNSIPIPGSRTLARSGASVALSGNGAMLAIGEPAIDAVRLLSKDGSKWIQQEFLEGPPGSEFGLSVVMSGGSTNVVNNPSGRAPVIIAIGAKGQVRVYNCTILRCLKVGEDIIGPIWGLGPVFGEALAMSGNGGILAVSASPGYGYIDDKKMVYIYHISDLGREGYVRDLVIPVKRMWNFGEALSLSANGDFLAVGSSTGVGPFIVHMYKRNGTSYAYDDAEFVTPGHPSHSLQAVSLSNDALVLAIGSSFEDFVPGAVVYQRAQTDLKKWTKRGLITGSCCSVDLNSDGSIITVGTDNAGDVVRTYKWNNSYYEQLWNDVPGGETSALALSDSGSVLAVGLPSSEFNRGGTTVYGFLSDCGNGTNMFRLSLTFDGNADQTRWCLISSSGEIVMEGENYAKKYSFVTLVEESCLKNDECFKFTIFHPSTFQATTKSEGITPPGGYSIYLNGEERHKGGNFTRSESVDIGNCACSEGSSRVRTVITVGDWNYNPPNNTRWEIVGELSNKILLQGSNYSHSEGTYVEDACVSTEACYSFSIFQKDAYLGENIVFVADYTLYLDGKMIKEGSDTTYGEDPNLPSPDVSETFRFGNNCGPTSAATSSPTSPPTSAPF